MADVDASGRAGKVSLRWSRRGLGGRAGAQVPAEQNGYTCHTSGRLEAAAASVS